MISEVYSNKTPLTTLWGTGANLSLISKEAVMKLGLKGQPLTLSITKIGNNTDGLMSMEYKLPSTALGGTIGVKLGLMPDKIAEVGNIQLMENQFGLCLRGTHPLLKIEGDVCSNHAAVNCNLLSASIEQGHVHSIQLSKMNNLVKDFMEIEGLGIKVTPLCGNCKYGKCISAAKEYTIKEERKMKMIDASLQFNE